MLDEWSVVALDVGKLEGYGYGNNFHDNYGEECGERFVIQPNKSHIWTPNGVVARVDLNNEYL